MNFWRIITAEVFAFQEEFLKLQKPYNKLVYIVKK